jgi:hypothetical protein
MATNSRRSLSGNIAERILVDTNLQFETSFIIHGVFLKERKVVSRKLLLNFYSSGLFLYSDQISVIYYASWI